MKAITKLIFLNEQGEKFFGEGPYQLLKKVEETGSLNAGAKSMGMAYSKATMLLHNAEEALGFSLTHRTIGGKAGGGSVLTEEAKDFLNRYEAYRNACMENNSRLYEEYFGEEVTNEKAYGCVIMASGLGRRFGGDKLMVDLCGKPMMQYILDAAYGLFDEIVVVTRNEKVRDWCEEKKILVVFHAMPDRNDTIRLGLGMLKERLGDNFAGCAFCPADMPFVARQSLENMMHLAKTCPGGILRMSFQGKIGAPNYFDKTYFDELMKLPKGKGGSVIARKYSENVHCVEVTDERELWDVDTQEDYEKLKNTMEERKF